MSAAGVVIVYRDALFAEGLASLLRAEGSVQVLAMTAGESAASDQIQALGPMVVILEGDRPTREHEALLGSLLAATPYVVEVGLRDDTVAVYQRTRVRHSQRFVDLVTRLARRAYLTRERGDVQPSVYRPPSSDSEAITPEEGYTCGG